MFALEPVARRKWFGSHSLGVVKRLSSARVIRQAAWCSEWLYEMEAWFCDRSTVTVVRTSSLYVVTEWM